MAGSGAGYLTLSGDIPVTPVPVERPEGADVTAAAGGDALAFKRLYRRHSVRIHNLARRMMGTQEADELTQAPTWMALTLGGQYADVTVEGAQGDVTVETVHGDINVRGGSGFVSLKTVHGIAVLEGAKGRSEVRSVNEAVRLIGVSGDTYVETNNGRITFEKMDAKNVEASTVNDDIVFEGTIHKDGVYRLATHNGNVVIGVPEGTNATINVRTFNGGFNSSVQGKVEEVRKNRRYVVTFGSGSGRVDLESFGGSIRLRKPEEIRMRAPRDRPKHDRDESDEVTPRPNPNPYPNPQPNPKPNPRDLCPA